LVPAGSLEFSRDLIERGVHSFVESSYVSTQNKQQPMFFMDPKGFVLLAMGFTDRT